MLLIIEFVILPILPGGGWRAGGPGLTFFRPSSPVASPQITRNSDTRCAESTPRDRRTCIFFVSLPSKQVNQITPTHANPNTTNLEPSHHGHLRIPRPGSRRQHHGGPDRPQRPVRRERRHLQPHVESDGQHPRQLQLGRRGAVLGGPGAGRPVPRVAQGAG